MKKLLVIVVLGLLWCNTSFAESKLPACEGTKWKKWTDCHGTRVYKDNDKKSRLYYVGEWKKGKMDGQGTMKWSYGMDYVGEWKDDKFHGQGALTWFTGSYVGEYQKGKRHGQGVGTNSQITDEYTMIKYEGEHKNDKANGQGIGTYYNGDVYVGGYKNWIFHGEGVLTDANGKVFDCIWKNGTRKISETCSKD